MGAGDKPTARAIGGDGIPRSDFMLYISDFVGRKSVWTCSLPLHALVAQGTCRVLNIAKEKAPVASQSAIFAAIR